MSSHDVFLVTGAAGCLGSWVIRQLVGEQTDVVAFDVSPDRRRLELVLDRSDLGQLPFAVGDIRDGDRVAEVVASHKVTHIIHLAAVTVNPCRANPILGAQIDVLGTLNVFEAAVAADVEKVAFASTVAVFGEAGDYDHGRVTDQSPAAPRTLYGAYKHANEEIARVYAKERGLGLVGLRPCVVYGPGRDQGLTSGVSLAMLSAAAGRPYHVPHGGRTIFQFAEDIAQIFIDSARAVKPGDSQILNISGTSTSVEDALAAIEAAAPEAAGTLTWDGPSLPFPSDMGDDGLRAMLGDVDYTTIMDGAARSIAMFRDLIDRGVLDPTSLRFDGASR